MAGRSTIDRDPAVRAAVDEALASGATLDEITASVRALSKDISRSAIGRYAQKYREIANKQRDMAAVARAFAAEFGEEGDKQTRLLVQLATTMATKMALHHATTDPDDDDAFSIKALADFARAVKDITSAAKSDVDRDAKVRDEARKKAQQEAVRAATAGARAAGASAETIDTIKRRILGLA